MASSSGPNSQPHDESASYAALLYPPGLVEHCIYKVPERFRKGNEEFYRPRVVSIGPYHYKYIRSGDIKLEYGNQFCDRYKVTRDQLTKVSRELGARARRYYSESVQQSAEDFELMIVVDGIFLLELMLRSRFHGLMKAGDDPIFNQTRILVDIYRDIFLMENQLPLFVLQELYQQFVLPHPPADDKDHLSLARLAHYFFNTHLVDNNNTVPHPPADKKDHLSLARLAHYFNSHLVGNNNTVNRIPSTQTDHDFLFDRNSKAHLVAFVRSFYSPRWKSTPSSSSSDNVINVTVESIPPSVTELYEAGVKFEQLNVTTSGDTAFSSALNIEFDRGSLKIPCLNFQTGTLLLNLMVFEEYGGFPSGRKYVSQFMFFMGCMIRTSRDVDILIQSAIISRMLGSNGDLLALFDRISKMGWPHDYFYLCEQLNGYCKSNPWHKWKATLKREYFDTPWKIASTIAAVILLLLTLMQTVCSFLQLKH
ncbi:unnamed protein product [Malus baccata var. baccata]